MSGPADTAMRQAAAGPQHIADLLTGLMRDSER